MPRPVNTSPFSAYLRSGNDEADDRPVVPLGRVLTELLRNDGATAEELIVGSDSREAVHRALNTLEGLGLVDGDEDDLHLTEEGKRAAELQRG